MKKLLSIVFLVSIVLMGCGGALDFGVQASDRCKGTGPLLISNLTPTTITLIHSTGVNSFNMDVDVSGARCNNMNIHSLVLLPSSRIEYIDFLPSTADSFHLSLDAIKVDTTYFTAQTGTISFWITTPTGTSNQLNGTLVIQ